MDNLRSASEIVAFVHIVFLVVFYATAASHSQSREKRSRSLGSSSVAWSGVVGFQGNKADFQSPSTFTACTPVSASSLEKNDRRFCGEMAREKCLLSEAPQVLTADVGKFVGVPCDIVSKRAVWTPLSALYSVLILLRQPFKIGNNEPFHPVCASQYTVVMS